MQDIKCQQVTVNSPHNKKSCEWKSKEKTWNIQTHQVVSWLLSFPRFRENPPVIIKLIFWLIKLTWEHKSSRRGGKAKNKKDDIDESFGWIIVKSDAKIANWEDFIFHFPFNRIRFSQNHLTFISCLLFFRNENSLPSWHEMWLCSPCDCYVVSDSYAQIVNISTWCLFMFLLSVANIYTGAIKSISRRSILWGLVR